MDIEEIRGETPALASFNMMQKNLAETCGPEPLRGSRRPCSLQCLSQGEDRKTGNTARAEAGKLVALGGRDGPRLDAEETGGHA